MSSVYVPHDYVMDPAYEDLIYGDQLEDGMIVLIESILVRADPERGTSSSSYERRRVRDTARWCEVTNLRRSTHDPSILHFIGVYSDGSKAERTYNVSYAWYVKKESIQ